MAGYYHPEDLAHFSDMGKSAPDLWKKFSEWYGDCDFNQMLDLPIGYGAPAHLRDFEAALLQQRRILWDNIATGAAPAAVRAVGAPR